VRENRLEVVTFLLERDHDPTGLAVNESLIEIARDVATPKCSGYWKRNSSNGSKPPHARTATLLNC